ncbi:MAG: hypothetical protein HQK93_03380 [Nitrospirae bacterium]|nr:hypothetical protein [Nitrospirota bacterium]
MQATLPIEVYEALEKSLGKETAKIVVKSIETTITDNIENKWKTSKDELLEEMGKRFSTKADLLLFESRLNVKFVIIIFTIILLNPKALELISKIFSIVK